MEEKNDAPVYPDHVRNPRSDEPNQPIYFEVQSSGTNVTIIPRW